MVDLKSLYGKINPTTWNADLSQATTLMQGKEHHFLHGYTPGPNELSLEDRERIAKKRHQQRTAARKDRDVMKTTSTLPTAVDWRNINGRNFVTSVKVQSLCGACAAFGTVATIESQARIDSKIAVNDPNGASLPELSEAQLFFSSTDHNCLTGWNVESALNYATQTGVVPESCSPYVMQDFIKNECTLCDGWQNELTTINGNLSSPRMDAMKQWLSKRGPLITCFTIYLDLLFYRSGVYIKNEHSPKLGGHCVSCIGYDDSKQAWLCKNSWGTKWGENGFFWIGYGQCGIDAEMWGIKGFTNIYKC